MKVVAFSLLGASGWCLWKSETASGAFFRCKAGSQEFSAGDISFHLTKYCNCLFLILESITSSTSISSSESTIICLGMGGILPFIVSFGALVSSEIWKVSCTPFLFISSDRRSWYVRSPIFFRTSKGPILFFLSFLVMSLVGSSLACIFSFIFLASKNTLSPGCNSGISPWSYSSFILSAVMSRHAFSSASTSFISLRCSSAAGCVISSVFISRFHLGLDRLFAWNGDILVVECSLLL